MRETISRLLSKGDTVALLEIIHGSLSCYTDADFKCLIEKLNLVIPFDYSVSGLAKVDASGMKNSYEIVNMNYPAEWLEQYVLNNFADKDPIVRENFTKFNLQYWADTYKSYGPDKNFLSLAEDFGLREGYTHGARNLKGDRGSLFSVGGISIRRHPRTEAIIKLVTPHFHQALLRILDHRGEGNYVSLTPKEKEVLNWVKDGKSSWEISVILGISARTVKFHANNIMQKLDVVNRAQAVAVAIERGLIDFD